MTQRLASLALADNTIPDPSETWDRPADWPALPTIIPGEQRFAMLCAVYNTGGANYIRLDPAGCAYTIDWGDGSAPENFIANAAAQHSFSYAGATGAVTSLGYKTAIVQVYPQGDGAFSGFAATLKHASAVAQASSGILDFEFSSPTSTIPTLSNSSITQTNWQCQHWKAWSSVAPGLWSYAFFGMASLRSIEGLELSMPVSLSNTFNACFSLIHGPKLDTKNVFSMNSTFGNCKSMVDVPAYDYSAANSVSGMFSGCSSLRSVSAMNTGNCWEFSSLFSNCSALTSVAGIDTTKATAMNAMFQNCRAMVTFPKMNTSACCTMLQMFNNCLGMTKAPWMDTSNVTNMQDMFNGCYELRTVPLYDTLKVTNMQSMFNGCQALRTVPFFDTSNVTNTAAMFNGCLSLLSVPEFNLTNCVNAASMFSTCYIIASIALVNTSKITLAGSFASNCNSLQNLSMDMSGVVSIAAPFASNQMMRSVILTGLRYTVAVNGNQLGATALDALYTSLGTAVGAQVVTVTTNPGTTGDTASIATSKGWTVTGS